MTSMRTLRRRLRRWERYTARYGTHWSLANATALSSHRHVPPGHRRAYAAVEHRTGYAYTKYPGGRCCCGGCIGMGPCDDDLDRSDDDGCCAAGEYGHDGPCWSVCSACDGDGRCPNCGGEDDLGCEQCGGSLSCNECWGKGEIVDDVLPWSRPVATVETRGLT